MNTMDKKRAFADLNNYEKKNSDRITILVPKGRKEQLTKISKENGYRTLTEFINTCVKKEIERSGLEDPKE